MLELCLVVVASVAAIAAAPAAPIVQAPVRSIADAIDDGDGDFVADRLDEVVALVGVVSAGPHVARGETNYIVIQDDTAGIRLMSADEGMFAAVAPGAIVEVTGLLTHRRGVEELFIETLRVTGNTDVPAPREVLVADLLSERYAHQLVRVIGNLTFANVTPGEPLGAVVSDRSGSIPVRITARLRLDAELLSHLPFGGEVSIVGIAGQSDREPPFDEGYRLAPREAGDIVFAPAPPYAAVALSVLFITLAGWIAVLWVKRRSAERRADDLAVLAADLEASRQALVLSEENYRLLFEEDLTGNFVVARDGRVLTCNKAFAATFGFASSNALIEERFSLGHEEQDWKVLQETIAVEGKAEMFSLGVPGEGTEPMELLVNVRASNADGIYADSGDEGAYSGSLVDITERRQLERQLLQAQKMEALGRMAGGIAHDLNNMLTTVMGTAEMLLARSTEAKVVEGLTWIREAAERSADLSRRLLALSRQKMTQPRVIDLNEELRELTPILRGMVRADVGVDVRCGEGAAWIEIDPAQLRQVLLNLAINANEAMPAGGKLLLETGVAGAGSPRDGDAPGDSSEAFIRVTDTGSGIDAATHEHMIEPFFSTKDSGSGLGLAIVYGVVQRVGGTVEVDSEVGRGTTFEIRIPGTNPAERAAGDEPSDEPHIGTGTILLAEDDPNVRSLAQEALERAGYTVVGADDGSGALQMFNDGPGRFDLLLTDVVMPVMGGAELARKVSSARPDLPVVFTSGFVDDAEVSDYITGRSAVFLQKPWSVSELLTTVAKALAKDGAA